MTQAELNREFGYKWYCRRCHCERGPIWEKGQPMSRQLYANAVTIFLECGHTTVVHGNLPKKES